MRKQVNCECGCKTPSYFNQLEEVTVEAATDETLRDTKVVKRFFVRHECAEPFRDELALMQLLHLLVTQATRDPWWRRIARARKVAQFQFAIHERTRGVEYASRKSKQSAILFAAPKWMQGVIARRFLAREQKRHLAMGSLL